jgi:hypothetical protein
MITFEIAKEYLDKGWSIFPVVLSLDANGKVLKKPAIAWREYQERLPTIEELHRWFDDKKYNGIGMATGKICHLVVVDVDRFVEDEKIYSQLAVKTISGGHHYFFQWTEEMRNDAKIEGQPIDFRGDGGYVVLPPSGIGEQKYTWEKTIETMYLTPVPQYLKDKLKILLHKLPTKIQSSDRSDKLDLPLAYEGERNQTATRVAGILTGNIAPKLWESIGWTSFQQWNQSNCTPPLDDKELRITWNSITSTHTRNHPDEDVELEVYKGHEITTAYKDLQTIFGQGLETGFMKIDRYFKFLPDQLYLLSSATHQGKTTLSLNMAARIASLGEPVMYFSLEQGLFIEPRIRSMIEGDIPEALTIVCSSQTVSIQKIIEHIDRLEKKPKLIVIDHLHFIKKKGNDTTDAIDNMIIDLSNMAKRLHVPVFVIAHVRKLNADRPPELDDLRDSSSLSQVPSVVMFLYRKVEPTEASYLSKNGTLFIAKNRIQGITGIINFQLADSGKFIFY